MADAFKSSRVISYVGALSLTFILVLLWPSVATVAGIMHVEAFSAWVRSVVVVVVVSFCHRCRFVVVTAIIVVVV